MDFNILLLLICSTSMLEASERIPLKKVVSKINYYKSGGHISKQAVKDGYKMHEGGLIVNVTVNDKTSTTVPLLLNSLAPNMWVVSDKCKSSFCNAAPSKLPQNQDEGKKVDNGLVQGYNQTLQISLLSRSIPYEFLVADLVSTIVAKSAGDCSGAIPLFNLDLWKEDTFPNGQLFICFSSDPTITGMYAHKPTSFFSVPDSKTYYLKSSPREPWNVAINHITLGLGQRKIINTVGSYATIDTTFNAIGGPTDDINLINSIIGTDENGIIDCRRLPFLDTIVFHFGSNGYPVLPKDYIIKNDDPFDFRQCKSAFVPHDNNHWRIGLPFLARYVMELEVGTNQIALHQLKKNY